MRVSRTVLTALAAMGVAGCLGGPGTDNSLLDGTKAAFRTVERITKATPPLSKVVFANGDVVVGGPDDYCVDPNTLEKGTGRGFAVIASCNVLSKGKLGVGVDPITVTVTVGPRVAQAPSPAELAEAAGAPLLAGQTANGLTLAHLGKGGSSLLKTSDPRYWRGAFVQNGRLVGLALYAPNGNAYAGDAGAGFLKKVRARIATLSKPAQSAPNAKRKRNPLIGGLFKR